MTVGDRELRVERRAGTDERPLVRLSGVSDRDAAAALRREPLLVPAAEAPLQEGEWLTEDLVGCEVPGVGTVQRVIAAPSCDVLAVGDDELLIPLVADAVKRVDTDARIIEVDLAVPRTRGDPRGSRSGEDRRLHAVPELVRLVQGAAPRPQRPRARARAERGGPAGDDASQRRAGGRHALRRRGRDGDPRGRGGGCARRALRRRSRRGEGIAQGDRACRRRAALRRRARERARRRAGADAALRALRGLRRAGARAPGHGCRVDRAVRAVGRRAGGDGGVRRRVAQAARARSATRTARSRSRSARRSMGRRSTRTTRARPSGAATPSPTCCSRETTARSASGASIRAVSARAGTPRPAAPAESLAPSLPLSAARRAWECPRSRALLL